MQKKKRTGRPRKESRQVSIINVQQDELQIFDIPELIKLLYLIVSLSNILINIKTGSQQDDERKKEAKEINNNQKQLLKQFRRDDNYIYFLRRTPDRLKIVDGKLVNETSYIQKVEGPKEIHQYYQKFYDFLNIFVKELDQEFVPEFMEIVNTFINGKLNNHELENTIETIISDIKKNENYKLTREWYLLKQNCHPIQIRNKQIQLEKYRTQISLKKSRKVIQKQNEIAQTIEQELIQEQPNILEYFIRGLVDQLNSLVRI